MREDKIKKAYKETRNIYDDVLTQNNWWARLYINLFWGVDDNKLADKVLKFIPDDFSGKLLDIPVGTAVFTYQKYDLLKKAEIVCVDYSEEMIKKAKERLAKISNKRITCQQGDVRNLDFDDESYDILLSMNGFHAFPDKIKAFKETARVIKKGGFFIGCFYIKKEKKLTDLIVNMVLSKKGWFTPPFQTKKELEDILERLYTSVELFSDKSMVWFKCTK
ncbi:MAG: class I SAM-dependent methyltransferase [Spirochaetes bacterium]|nr:class I SAM-dependent methyltransferase [Spirochaetota bacterium]MBN2772538.1 class I SAM-dependent methyltransferase [Spirochaetota bacterium]